ncbi:histidine phosphotransferase [Amylibacter marinus]|uniref:Histidine phosphotransferase n=1 Tax=Amylibacter marinus TaxID=1475483 RepID=A0ABQ5VY77_9RHOB|nr:histidine phosphotransferase family protein [Amylibacter marinus]GLQ36041.1 histidine phosphotransferase [Amylibacter marinus]
MTQSYTKNSDIASLITSRICHDLVNPLGAINNGLELMELSGTPMSEEYMLLCDSVKNANARVNFFRVAFGPAHSQAMSSAQVHTLVEDMFLSGRCRVKLNITGEHPREQIKMLFLIIQCCENALPRGGDISAAHMDGKWRVRARGARIQRVNTLWDHLEMGADSDISAADIHFAIAREYLEYTGAQLAVEFHETEVSILLTESIPS